MGPKRKFSKLLSAGCVLLGLLTLSSNEVFSLKLRLRLPRQQTIGVNFRSGPTDQTRDEVTLHSAAVKSKIPACGGKLWLTAEAAQPLSNLTNWTRVWHENARALVLCDDAVQLVTNQPAVPRIIHRIWECAEVPKRYFPSLESWQLHATGAYTFLWTSDLRERLIKSELGEYNLKLYRRLVPGAYRADFFRYFILSHFGGVYSDLDTFLCQDLWSILDFNSGPTLAIDLVPTRLLQGAILVSPAKNPLFTCAMGEVLDHAARRLYPGSDLDISGPGVLGECLRHVLGLDELRFSPGRIGLGPMHFCLLTSFKWQHNQSHVVRMPDGSELIRLMPGGLPYDKTTRPDCDVGEHYSKLFKQRQVYVDDEGVHNKSNVSLPSHHGDE